MFTWLSYHPSSEPLKLPSISIQIANMPSLTIAEQVEAICMFMADKQNTNPLGLFQHPINNIETQLRFTYCDKMDHGKVVELLEAMYEYCNNPMHLHFDICIEQGVSDELYRFIKRHLLPFTYGGLIADDRGQASCFITRPEKN